MADIVEGYSENDIAIVGMACRVSGAENMDRYWQNLVEGLEASVFFSEDELRQRGVSQRQIKDPNYVPACMVLPHLESFDGEFFGLSPKESAIMDPQHRHFLECSWEALEDAGHVPGQFEGSIGVFAGCGMSAYFMFNIITNPELISSVGMFLLRHTGNDKDFLATRVSYALNLRGPSINVQTACSTSLVAVHMGCQSLLSFESDMVLAGGVTIEIPHYRGYHYKDGEILSPDGHCRAFDHRSRGTIFGSGAGVVALRRLPDALEDGDRIYAVIRGSALNNDGAGKVGYLAPSVDGQSAAVTEALAVADVKADTIDYVECHGTGTAVGDPIEIAALSRAYRETTTKRAYCGVGSVKTNIGHLDTAAGVASLIKATLALYHGKIPATINYERSNPNIDFPASPFYVVDRLTDWPKTNHPRRAAINSLGVGGTNAHAILQEAPPAPAPKPSKRTWFLLPLSARNRGSLDDGSQRLADYLELNQPDLADVASTLWRGRERFEHRRVVAAHTATEAARLLRANDTRRVYTHRAGAGEAKVVYMFPGGGVQYPNMGKGLYENEPVFRQYIDAGLNQLQREEGLNFRRLLFPEPEERDHVAEELLRPSLQLPLIFLVEYALARVWMSKGLEPSALIGHSLGENTAACLAGVFSFSDALGLVSLRGKLFETLPLGGMLSVQMNRTNLEQILPESLDLAVVNSPEVCVVSGPVAELDAFAEQLKVREVEFRKIHIDVAAHSRMLEPILAPFGDYLRRIRLSKPAIPFISNRTGGWITTEQATDPQYWVDHLRHSVFFAEGIGTLLAKNDQVLLEVGPGTVLTSLARQHPQINQARATIPSLRHPEDDIADDRFLLTALGRLWACGARVSAEMLGQESGRRHLSLPHYAFRRLNYWIEPGLGAASEDQADDKLLERQALEDWYYRVVWQEQLLVSEARPPEQSWLVFIDDLGIGRKLCDRLRAEGQRVITVREGDVYRQLGEDEFLLSPEAGLPDYGLLVRALLAQGKFPDRVAHLWMLTLEKRFRPGSSFFHRNQERGFYSLFFLARALGEEDATAQLHLIVAVNGMHQVADEPLLYPDKATLLGPAKVIPREFPGSTCRTVDLVLPAARPTLFKQAVLNEEEREQLCQLLYSELAGQSENAQVALRDGRRFVQHWQQQKVGALQSQSRLRDKGVYLITGGLGGVGLIFAQHLAHNYKAKLVLVTRPGFPVESEWEDWLASHGSSNATSARIRAVQELRQLGAEVMVVLADVTDLPAMEKGLELVKQRFGQVNGVFHAAGVLRDGPIGLKSQSEVEQVFSPKVHGTLILEFLFEKTKLDFFVLFSSSSTALAPPGQVDYVAANEFLNAFATAKAKQFGAVSINWGTWNEIGMTAGLAGTTAREAGSAVAAEQPLFSTRTTDSHGRTTLQASLSTDAFWVLGEHRTAAGAALIPGTGYLELAREALLEQSETRAYEICDLYFLRPLHVAAGQTKEMRVRLRPESEGFAFSVQSLYTSETGNGWETHAEARLVPCGPSALPQLNLDEIRARMTTDQKAAPGAALRTKQFEHLQLGARWSCIRRMGFGQGEALAELSLSQEFATDMETYVLHPALLDMATGYPMDLIEGYERSRELWVPVSYGSVRIYGRLPARIFSWARNHGRNSIDGDIATFDITITDPSGKVLLEVDAFSVKKMAGDPNFDSFPQPGAQDLEYDQAIGVGGLSPSELILRHNVDMGIKAEEGVQILERVLRGGHASRVLVSPLELGALLKQVDDQSRERVVTGNKFARPELDSDYAAPTDDVERKLVGFWEELLGVNAVGIEDNFFELGGHSLIAVRLFSSIRKAFQVEFPISILFEAPTIQRVAELIRESRPEGFGEQGGSEKIAPTRKRHTHLVTMHVGKPGPRTPFFLVAGMFGNVLNLRHLAHLIGTDRPFYGLQARGLYGGDEPHRDFVVMAADYIAEIRTVQPEGPYLLGGFSGGGITAYEIAQQLLAQGEQVDLLVMLDTPLPIRPSIGKPDKFKIHRQNLKERGSKYISQWAKDRLVWEVGKLRRKFGDEPTEAGQLNEAEFHSHVIEQAFREALLKYDLKRYPGKVTLFRPALDEKYHLGEGRVVSSALEFVFHDNGWTPHVEELEIQEVPGDHDSMVLEPNVRNLAARLAAALKKSEAH